MGDKDLEEALEMGMDWSLREGYCWAEDKEHCEEYGRVLNADPSVVSNRAKKRGLPQLGTLSRLHSYTPRQASVAQGSLGTLLNCSDRRQPFPPAFAALSSTPHTS